VKAAFLRLAVMTLGCLSVADCRQPGTPSGAPQDSLVGEWREQLQFATGAFAAVKDLEFMYVFNLGGTMTESSNYDAAPPVPPAYGIWRQAGPREYEAKYEYYATRPPAAFDEITSGGGWLPAGRGVFTERITLSEDGRTFSSQISYEAFDTAGQPTAGGGEATGHGTRLTF
jgi:hypothetical protein